MFRGTGIENEPIEKLSHIHMTKLGKDNTKVGDQNSQVHDSRPFHQASDLE